ncbi:amino acid permease [Pseudarthrobacter sp. CCNWLW217]
MSILSPRRARFCSVLPRLSRLAVLISYLVAGTLIILVMWALGEMAAANPDSGAFSVYTAEAYGPVVGATVGWLWWLQLVVVIAAEALGAAGLMATIFPALPVWLMAFVFIVVLTGVNLTSVKNFGEFEFWFVLLKVAAIVGFLLVGAALLFGWLAGVQSPDLANFTGDGFAPSGFGGIATALFWWRLHSAAPRLGPWRQPKPPSRPEA